MKPFALILTLLATAAPAEDAPVGSCMRYQVFTEQMAANGAVITMADVVQDGSDRRLEAYYQPKECTWTLAIVQRSRGKISGDSNTCLLGIGDPGVCIPQR